MKIRNAVLGSVAFLMVATTVADYFVTSGSTAKAFRTLSRQQLHIAADSVKKQIVSFMRTGADHEAIIRTLEELKVGNPIIVGLELTRNPPESEPGPSEGDQTKAPVQQTEEHGGHFVFPVLADASCLPCHDTKIGGSLGALSVTVDVSPMRDAMEGADRLETVFHVAETAIVVLLITILLATLVFRPLGRLVEKTDRIAAGDFSGTIAGESNSEIGRLISAFNIMTARIRDQVAVQNEAIREKTLSLQLMLDSAHALGGSLVLSEVLNRLAESLTRSARVTFCRVILREESRLAVKAACPVRVLDDFGSTPPAPREEACPELVAMLASGTERLFKNDDSLAREVRKLLLLDEAHSVLCVPITYRNRSLGFAALGEFRSWEREPIDDEKIALCRALVGQAGSALENAHLHGELMSHSQEAVLAMATAVDAKSRWTAGHSHRVTTYAVAIATEMGWTSEQIEGLRIAGLLHDIGKIGTPGNILDKPGKLTDEEYDIIKRHPLDGVSILSPMKQFRELLPAIRHHHERFDGGGYPERLAGEDIPLTARVLMVADAYDAMTADRPYRKALSPAEATSRILECSGTQFDPLIVRIHHRFSKSQP